VDNLKKDRCSASAPDQYWTKADGEADSQSGYIITTPQTTQKSGAKETTPAHCREARDTNAPGSSADKKAGPAFQDSGDHCSAARGKGGDKALSVLGAVRRNSVCGVTPEE